MHSGFALVPGILKAFALKCPHLKDFLEARLTKSKHLRCRSLFSKAIKPINKINFRIGGGRVEGGSINGKDTIAYATMIANPWQDKNILNNKLFEKNDFAKPIKLLYFDIPELHEFSANGNKFFDIL